MSGGYSGGRSPILGGGLSGASPDVSRQAAEWEQQIESLDKKELEIHQTQLKLIREQTNTFRAELAKVSQKVEELSAVCADHADKHAAHLDMFNLLDKNRADSDAAFAELAKELPNHAKEIWRMRDEVAAHAAMHGKHAESMDKIMQHHAAIPERIEYIEKLLGDSADRHEQQKAALDALHKKYADTAGFHKHAASMEDRMTYLEKTMGDSLDKHIKELADLKQSHEKHKKDTADQKNLTDLTRAHASVEQRLEFLEKQVGESADKYNRDMRSLQEGHSKMGGAHASIGDRMAYIENLLGDNADKHNRAVEEAHAKLDKHLGRLEKCEDAGEQLKQLHKKIAQDKDALANHHANLEDRIGYLEKVTGDSADKHAKELKALKDAHLKHVQETKGAVGSQGQAHASIESRLDYIEKVMGDSADKHSSILRELKEAQSAHSKNTKMLESRAEQHASIEDRMKYIEQVVGDSADKHAKAVAAAHAKLEALQKTVDVHKRERDQHGKSLEQRHGEVSEKHASIEDRIGKLENNYKSLDQWATSFHPAGRSR